MHQEANTLRHFKIDRCLARISQPTGAAFEYKETNSIAAVLCQSGKT